MRESLSHAAKNKYGNVIKTEKKQQQHEKKIRTTQPPWIAFLFPYEAKLCTS